MQAHGPILAMLGGTLLAGTLGVMTVVTVVNRAETGAPVASRSTPEATVAPGATPRAGPDPKPPAKADYTGRADNGIAIAIGVRNGKAVAYVCDGRRVERWLHGVDGDGVSLGGGKGATLTATRTAKKITGHLRLKGERLEFTASRARKPSGLYRATRVLRGVSIDGTWIILPDGSQVGVVNKDGRPAPAPSIDPYDRTTTVGGEKITASPVTPKGSA